MRGLAQQPGVLIFFSPHAEIRMLERKVSRIDVEAVLRTGAVIDVESRWSGDRWTVQGSDQDGRAIRVVAIPNEDEIEIVVVTVMT
jgi:uncharacterized DUF497 family protein